MHFREGVAIYGADCNTDDALDNERRENDDELCCECRDNGCSVSRAVAQDGVRVRDLYMIWFFSRRLYKNLTMSILDRLE